MYLNPFCKIIYFKWIRLTLHKDKLSHDKLVLCVLLYPEVSLIWFFYLNPNLKFSSKAASWLKKSQIKFQFSANRNLRATNLRTGCLVHILIEMSLYTHFDCQLTLWHLKASLYQETRESLSILLLCHSRHECIAFFCE